MQAKTVAKESADLLNELLMWAHLRHPNLTMFLGACTAGSPMIVVSEYMPGGTVETRLLNSDLAPIHLVQRWAVELARAVCFLHNCNPPVIHRRILPSNLLLSADDHLSLTHFAASQFLPRRRAAPRRSRRQARDAATAAAAAAAECAGPDAAESPSVCEARDGSLERGSALEDLRDGQYAAPETRQPDHQWDEKVPASAPASERARNRPETGPRVPAAAAACAR